MPTAITSDYHPIHNWFNFIAGYSPEYVETTINNYRDRNGVYPDLIYDPFVGCGTTCVVSNNMNIRSIGIERNPFFFKIGYTKAHAIKTLVYADQICEEFLKLSSQVENTNYISKLSKSASEYLGKLFSSTSLNILLKLRNLVRSYRDYKYYMGYTFLSKMMEFVTTSKTDGIYKAPSSKKKSLSIDEAIKKTWSIISSGKISKTNDLAKIYFDSCIKYNFPSNVCDLVIFSPPYLNNFDFAEMTRMQLYFWEEATSWQDITENIRCDMLINTTTALKYVRNVGIQEHMRRSLPKELLIDLEPLVNQLKSITIEDPRKKQYYLIIYPYLYQMQIILQKCYNCLKPHGEIHIVVSDAAFYGLHIDTQKFLCLILSAIGFSEVKFLQMRARGDRWILEKRKASGKQLGEYEIIASKQDYYNPS